MKGRWTGLWLAWAAWSGPACNIYSCSYNEPDPEEWQAAKRDTPIVTDDGHFEVTLQGDPQWPPRHDPAAVIVQVTDLDPDDDYLATTVLADGLPFDPNGDEEGSSPAELTATGDARWTMRVALPSAGRWSIPLALGVGDGDAFEAHDTITLNLEVQP